MKENTEEMDIEHKLEHLNTMAAELEELRSKKAGSGDLLVIAALEKVYTERESILSKLRSRGTSYSVVSECAHIHRTLQEAMRCADRNKANDPECSFFILKRVDGEFEEFADDERGEIMTREWIRILHGDKEREKNERKES